MFYSVSSGLYPYVLPIGVTLFYALSHPVYHTISYVSTSVLSNFTFLDPFSSNTISL